MIIVHVIAFWCSFFDDEIVVEERRLLPLASHCSAGVISFQARILR